MTWTRETVQTELIGLFRQHAQEGATVEATSHLVADLGIDSLGVMEVIADIEDKFGLVIPDEALREVDTIADVATAIETKLRADGRFSG
jgi:acyl carrier protein